MIKAREDSYDGRGNFVLRGSSQIGEVLKQFEGRPLMLQRFIPFTSEISVISARNTLGEVSTFPVGENIHGKDYNILLTTVVPARVSEEVKYKAKKIAEKTMDALQGAGVFGIEMFVVNEEVMINEIAPRVHNSGHHTIEACETSQFEQHLRAISGEKLGDTSLSVPCAVMHNILGAEGYTGPYQMTYDGQVVDGIHKTGKGVFVHDYGKHDTKPNRKMGHVTILGNEGENTKELLTRSYSIQKLIKIKAA
jgi:5-(carboxyamino)imidazole ribonucleotide synthase